MFDVRQMYPRSIQYHAKREVHDSRLTRCLLGQRSAECRWVTAYGSFYIGKGSAVKRKAHLIVGAILVFSLGLALVSVQVSGRQPEATRRATPIPRPSPGPKPQPRDGGMLLRTDCNDNGIRDIFDVLPKSFGLQAASIYSVGHGPQALATGDFDHDGDIDFAVANFNATTVSIYLNNGRGAFASPAGDATVTVGAFPRAVASTDFDSDGFDDLAVVHKTEGALPEAMVSILRGNVDGRLSVFATYRIGAGAPEVGAEVTAVVAAQLDSDGHPDLAVTFNHGATRQVVVLWNHGDGTFGEASRLDIWSNWASSLIAADFDRDGDQDLAVGSNDGRIAMIKNNGTRSLTTPDRAYEPDGPRSWARDYQYDVGSGNVVSMAVADVSGDGYPDLISANHATHTLSVFANRGGGAWGFTRTPVTLTLEADASSVDAADLDNDGLPDLAATTGETVLVILNKGELSFERGRFFTTGRDGVAIRAANLDRRAPADLVVANRTDDTVAVLLNESRISQDANLNGYPDECDIAEGRSQDCNGNGIPDECDLKSRMDFSTRRVTEPHSPFRYDPQAVSIDLNHDGAKDVVVANTWEQEDLKYFMNLGDGTVGPALASAPNEGMSILFPISGIAIAGGDYDGNGRDDFSVAENLTVAEAERVKARIKVYRQLSTLGGGSEWELRSNISLGTWVRQVISADLDHDGRLDLIVTPHYASGSIKLLLNDGSGRFETERKIDLADLNTSAVEPPASVVAADLDGDDRPELIFTVAAAGQVAVCKNTSTARRLRFHRCEAFAAGQMPRAVKVADFNRDHRSDLVVTSDYTHHVSILFGQGGMRGRDFAFMRPVEVDLGRYANLSGASLWPNDIVIDDFDGDGDLDLATANLMAGSVSVMRNKGRGSFDSFSFSAGVMPESVVSVDLDGNGKPDLAIADGNGGVTVLLNRSMRARSRDSNGNGRLDECE